MRFIVLFIFILNIILASTQSLNNGNMAYKNRDFKVALKYYKDACDQGSGEACYKAGEIYDIGLGVPTDESMALNYFQQACDLDCDKGCVTVKDRDPSLQVGW